MGVKGLWSLLNPVARPVQIESLEGKRLAIDSSIWLYQFQATMRDKDGRVLVNAHVLGFLRRINKLLFHGIKPVFVFDGGAPTLKRATIAERKRKKAGAAANHARMAEKLFSAQMRREAVKAAQAAREQAAAREVSASAVRYDDDAGEQIAEDAIYLEDLENGRAGPSALRMPRQSASTESIQSVRSNGKVAPTPPPLDPAEERRKKFRKHDPYRLPETSMPSVSTEEKPDARLATEAELQQFIDEMKPSDIDIESAEFRALPTEVQYEIIGDLRIRSRQQSHQRLTAMLRKAPTALDFSMAQIKHLSQRNALTQQLLTVTDMVGSAHLTIPVRIAAERNREYVLVKRGEEAGGGWALGIREGSKQKPIEVEPDVKQDSEDESDSDDSSIEEVAPPSTTSTTDPDVRENRRREILEAISARYAPKKPMKAPLDLPVQPFGASRKPGTAPLFTATEDDDGMEVVPTANDEALALALQQEELGSDEDEADPALAEALALSRKEAHETKSHTGTEDATEEVDSDDSMEEVSLVPSEAGTPMVMSDASDDEDDFEEITPLESNTPPIVAKSNGTSINGTTVSYAQPRQDSALPIPSTAKPSDQSAKKPSALTAMSSSVGRTANEPPAVPPEPIVIDDDEEKISRPQPEGKSLAKVVPSTMVKAPKPTPPSRTSSLLSQLHKPTVPSPLASGHSTPADETPPVSATSRKPTSPPPTREPFNSPSPPPVPLSLVAHEPERMIDEALNSGKRKPAAAAPEPDTSYEDVETDHEDDEDDDIRWSRSPSPARNRRPPMQTDPSTESLQSLPSEAEEDEGEMGAEEMVAEKDDYARFIAQIKNRDLNEVRTEIDDEIRILNNQNKVAMRDSDEITATMISQIQTLLRHFGIPYITAPMEAEAQCAKLAELGLVDGVITDDSDVFLFGGIQCFKNIFNDAKYAECFLLNDICRELSLTRERLISLAYLLGSDYTIGLPGVGPVVALELLSNFPGENGLDNFKEWWMKVQRGQDNGFDTDNKWKTSFKKRYAGNIYLTADWPNPLVREAYKYPTTDESEEPFHWGFPKLSALRSYLHEELSWSISKVDDELTPIVQRIARRGKLGALNKQGTLDPFFDIGAGTGNYAPRRRTTANVSKRLMAVIKAFREAEARVAGKGDSPGWGEMMQGLDPEDPKGRSTGKRRRKSSEPSIKSLEGDEGGGDDDEWEKKAVEVLEKIEDGETYVAEAVPPVKKKRTRKPKEQRKDGDTPTENTNGGGNPSEAGKPAAKRGGRKRKDTAESSNNSEMPPEERGFGDELEPIPKRDVKERRAQQKKWRRAVVSGSMN